MYKEQLTPRRASDKTKSVRSQSRSRDRNENKKSATSLKYDDQLFTSDEEDSPNKNRRSTSSSGLITEIYPCKKKSRFVSKNSGAEKKSKKSEKSKLDEIISDEGKTQVKKHRQWHF